MNLELKDKVKLSDLGKARYVQGVNNPHDSIGVIMELDASHQGYSVKVLWDKTQTWNWYRESDLIHANVKDEGVGQ